MPFPQAQGPELAEGERTQKAFGVAHLILARSSSRPMKKSLKSVLLALLGVGIAGLVAFGILVAFAPRIICSKHSREVAIIRALRTQLADYRKRTGVYPATEHWVQALGVDSTDAWGNGYVYCYPGTLHPNANDLFSARPDRIADTADDEWGKSSKINGLLLVSFQTWAGHALQQIRGVNPFAWRIN